MNYLWLCPCCLLLMGFFISLEHEERYVDAVILKGLASLEFVVLGFLSRKACTDLEFANLVMIGLILGLIADVMLNLRFVFKNKGKLVFLVGILIFLSGHLVYLAALWPKCLNTELALIVGAILSVIILIWIFTKIEAQIAFKIFGVFYIAAIVIMNSVAFKVLLESYSVGRLVFAIGALSFLISDIVLILNTFGKETKLTLRITNLTFYYIGQLLIALSLQLL